jgi:cytochrome c biogenesis protein CcmG, thiol:disulfide interchange protein DsbE
MGRLSEITPTPALRAGTAALLLALFVGCGSSGGGGGGAAQAPDYARALAGAPKPLAQLYSHANQLLPGGTNAFERQLTALKGHPVVVNKWASWCGPCRLEFPWFQRLSAKLGKRVAFVGVDSNDSDAAARTFLGELPVPYPSYSDPHQDIARAMNATVGFPGTAFYDRGGHQVFVRQGQYPSRAALEADIERYAK